MSQASKLALLKEMLEAAESSLHSAKQILYELVGTEMPAKAKYAATASLLEQPKGESNIVEGVFDGQNMIGPDGKLYPVPANYASKSKLIAGDVLKLTIAPDGSFLYKQIGPTERKRVTGPLVYEEGQYKVLADGKAYKVLLASVTYYRAEIGDQIVLLVPALEDSQWGAIDNVLPKTDILLASEEKPAKKNNKK